MVIFIVTVVGFDCEGGECLLAYAEEAQQTGINSSERNMKLFLFKISFQVARNFLTRIHFFVYDSKGK